MGPDRFELPKPLGATSTLVVGLPAPLKAHNLVGAIGFEPIQSMTTGLQPATRSPTRSRTHYSNIFKYSFRILKNMHTHRMLVYWISPPEPPAHCCILFIVYCCYTGILTLFSIQLMNRKYSKSSQYQS